MRGKAYAIAVMTAVLGITPAYAGKRVKHKPMIIAAQDHPRLCGEKPAMHGFPAMHGGSPPPMRGKD